METRARQRQEPGDTRAFPRKAGRQRDRRDGSGKIQRVKEKRRGERERERGRSMDRWR